MEQSRKRICHARDMPKRSQDLPEVYTEYEQEIAQVMGRRIKQRRLELGLTQELVRTRMELERVHVSRAQYSRIEAGESLLRATEIIALIEVLNVSCRWLLEGFTNQDIV
jgi:hypothetical protein